jgi:membrane protein DedA with SNARE-associated domain
VVAGPLAGVLRMPWKRFAIFNFLGASLWVSVIAAIGHKFGKHWDVLTEYVERFNLGFVIVAAVVIFVLWRWRRSHFRKP